MINVAEVSLHYGAIQALNGVSLEVRQGEIVSLIGANGAGKSSLIKALMAMQPLSGGQIHISGILINSQDKRQPTHLLAARGIALVPEGRRVFSDLTVRENLDLGGYVLNAKNLLRQQLELVFNLFPRLAERHRQPAGLLSGGEQQMLALGRALMSKPTVLLLDEPSLGLAPLIVQDVMRSIAKINQQHGTTVLLVEQNARQALALSQRSYVLENGQVTHSGHSSELLQDPKIQASYLGG